MITMGPTGSIQYSNSYQFVPRQEHWAISCLWCEDELHLLLFWHFLIGCNLPWSRQWSFIQWKPSRTWQARLGSYKIFWHLCLLTQYLQDCSQSRHISNDLYSTALEFVKSYCHIGLPLICWASCPRQYNGRVGPKRQSSIWTIRDIDTFDISWESNTAPQSPNIGRVSDPNEATRDFEQSSRTEMRPSSWHDLTDTSTISQNPYSSKVLAFFCLDVTRYDKFIK